MKESFIACLLIVLFCGDAIAQTRDILSTDFRKADSLADLFPHHSLKDLRILSNKLTGPLSAEAEKFRAIYKWVCLNIDNDFALYSTNKRQRQELKDPEQLKLWNTQFSARVFNILVEKHRTVCTGYAYLIRELATQAGLACKIIDGYGRTVQANIGGPGTPNHSWNAIQLDNQWYLCDATWSSGSLVLDNRTFLKKYDSAYFLADAESFVRNHYPLDTAWILLKEKPTLETFLTRPLIYSSAIKLSLLPVFPQSFNVVASRGQTISFKFSSHRGKPPGIVRLLIDETAADDSVNTPVTNTEWQLYSIEHVFTRKGTYAAHVVIDEKYLFSYNIVVE